jgi:hypothetical protein
MLGAAKAYATEHGVVRSPTGGEEPATIELAFTRLRAKTPGTEALPYRFTLVLRGRLLEGSSARQLDTFERSVSTRQYTFSQWTEDGGWRVAEELQLAARYAVEAFIDEWVLVVRGQLVRADPMNETDSGQSGFPPYVLLPTQPTAAASADRFARQFSPSAPSFEPRDVTFEWEAWPRSFTAAEPACPMNCASTVPLELSAE